MLDNSAGAGAGDFDLDGILGGDGLGVDSSTIGTGCAIEVIGGCVRFETESNFVGAGGVDDLRQRFKG